VQCTGCGRSLGVEDRVASMSGSVMGDEHGDAYSLCPACGAYTVETWWDNFTGVETVDVSGPLSAEAGAERVSLIRQCSRPWDKKCRCDAHRRYFGDALD
jgi:hypothetical protein